MTSLLHYKFPKPSFSIRRLIFIFILVVTTIISAVVVKDPLFTLLFAREVEIPAHLTPLEYIDQLKRADINHDGVINLFDYASVVEGDVYETNASVYESANIDKDGQVNALDLSIILSEFAVDVQEKIDAVYQNQAFAEAITDEIVLKNEAAIPFTLTEETSQAIAETGGKFTVLQSGKGKSGASFGREIIPSVLGTVSPFTGASSYSYGFVLPPGPAGFVPSLGISYSSQSVDDARACCDDQFKDQRSYIPSVAGHGFSLSGTGQIVRDTKGEKDVYIVNGQPYHRFILTLPSGISAELKYNAAVKRWVSIPQAFLKIEHNLPEKTDPQGFDFSFLDAGEWIITAKDGTKYYLGEENLAEKINIDGRIHGSNDIRTSENELIGTWGGNLYEEFDKADLCIGESEFNPCREREDEGKPVLMVNKWLLRKIVTPDGKTIQYTYQTQQNYLSYFKKKNWKNNIEFVTTTSYPKEVMWNEGKHRVVYEYEERPDKGQNQFMRFRLKGARVETKLQKDNAYALVRKYVLNYYDVVEKSEALGKNVINSFKASLLKSIKEYGSDGTSSLPAVSFKYGQYSFQPLSASGEAIYVNAIDNGFGGETHFSYQPYEFFAKTPFGNIAGKQRRVRVIRKIVVDKVENKSFRIDFDYHDSQAAFAERLRDAGRGNPPSGMQFLGHSVVETRKYDFDGSTLLAHSKTEFYQANTADKCFIPNPAKGQAKTRVVYNGDMEAVRTVNTYRYRLDGADNLDPSSCTPSLANQPYFIYQTRVDILAQEPDSQSRVIPKTAEKYISAKPMSRVRTISDNLEHDKYGNVTKSVLYGQVNPDTGIDENFSDNRHSFTRYLVNPRAWILGASYISFSSPDPDCDKKGISLYSNCQYGRTETLYDDENFGEAPNKGYITESRAYVDSNIVITTRQEYDQWGNVTKRYGPRPGKKTSGELIAVSETSYDSYYHSLPLEEKNALGQWARYDEYDAILQVPKIVKNQLSANPERYSASRMEFDVFGRLIRSYMPDPENPGFVLGVPSSARHFFITEGKGLVIREMRLASIVDGKYTYTSSDTSYDGLGNNIQSQRLSTAVEGSQKRIITSFSYDANGNTRELYESQTTAPVQVADYVPARPESIQQPLPRYVSNPAKVVSSTAYDPLGRVVETVQFGPDGTQLRNSTKYFANGTKSTNAKGVSTVTTTDSLGRTAASIVSDSSGGNVVITRSKYAASMIDKPTKTEILSPSTKDVAIITNKYDKGSRVLASFDPSLGSYEFTYDVLGNKLTEKSKNGDKVTYIYDVLGRVVKKTYPSDLYKKALRTDVEYTYDSGPNAIGMLVNVKHPVGEVSYEYDTGQRNTKTTYRVFDVSKTFTSQYDSLSQVTEIEYPDSNKFQYIYDREGNVKKTLLNGHELLVNVQYDKYGKKIRSEAVLGESHYVDSSSYDKLGRLTSFSITRGSETILSQRPSYNSVGEIDRIDETIVDKERNLKYEYDGFSQLTGMSGGEGRGLYEYDIFGRIQSKKEGSELAYTYNSEFPFFAPKSIAMPQETPEPSQSPTQAPTQRPTANPTAENPTYPPTPTSTPTSTPTNTPVPTSIPIPTSTSVPQQCTYFAKAFVRECTNADCSQWKALSAFDNNSSYGVANKWQRDTNGDKAATFFNDASEEGTGEDVVDYSDFTPPDSPYHNQSVKLYYDSTNWEIVKRTSVGVGGPTQGEIDQLPEEFVGDFDVTCGTNVVYGWYLRPKESISSLNAENTLSKLNLSYTAEGAMKGDFEVCYFYNTEGQLKQLKKKKNPFDTCSKNSPTDRDLSFYYDHEGTLVLQEEYVGGDLVDQTYFFGTYEEHNNKESGNTQRIYIPLLDHVSAVYEDKKLNGIIKDYISSTRLVVVDGKLEKLAYYPYGQNTSTQTPPETNKFFTGHRKLNGVSVYHAGARFYSPQMGLFVMPDQAQGPNRYAYGNNNPITFNDPSGNFVCPSCKVLADFSYSNNPDVPETIPDVKTQIAVIAKRAGIIDIGSLGLRIFDTVTGVGYRKENDPIAQYSEDLDKYISKSLAMSDELDSLAIMPMTVRSASNFTINVLRKDVPYQGGVKFARDRWRANRNIEPFLRESTNLDFPFAASVRDYKDFKRRANVVNGGRVIGREYRGLFVRVAGETSLRVSPQDPGLVKHAMLAGGTATDLAGEFTYGWFKRGGSRIFRILDVNLSSGGYRPRLYSRKLEEARRLLRNDLFRGLTRANTK